MAERAENLPEMRKKRKSAAVFWCIQGDAEANFEVDIVSHNDKSFFVIKHDLCFIFVIKHDK